MESAEAALREVIDKAGDDTLQKVAAAVWPAFG